MKIKQFIIGLFILVLLAPSVMAEEHDGDIHIFGLELQKLLNLGSGFLATLLFFLTQVAYKRTRNKRLKYVGIAFILFAIKGFITSHELFLEEIALIDPIASLIDFAILLVFFFGIIKK